MTMQELAINEADLTLTVTKADVDWFVKSEISAICEDLPRVIRVLKHFEKSTMLSMLGHFRFECMDRATKVIEYLHAKDK